MAENISDRNGRALEFAIVDHIRGKYKVKLNPQAIESQRRDKPKFDELPKKLKDKFSKCSFKIGSWINEINPLDELTILDRISDDQAKRGDVTDIRLVYPDKKRINLSIKHNHNAVKHQRPGALQSQCGFPNNSPESRKYKADYKSLISNFCQEAYELKPGAINFRELKAVDSNFINENLYQHICLLTQDFLNSFNNDAIRVSKYFEFIVGITDFYKVVVTDKSIEIMAYVDIDKPNSLKAKIRSSNYVDVSFSNGWVLSMRLHTASSKIKGVSIKFDTRVQESPIPLIVNIGI